MIIGVIMYQTSLTKGQELVAIRMTREFRKQGIEAYLITSPYHDNKLVPYHRSITTSDKGYIIKENEFNLGIPIIRVDGAISTWPPRRIMFRDTQAILRNLVEDLNIDTFIVHSTLWNGPEEVARFKMWSDMLRNEGLWNKKIRFIFMAHYQPPSPIHYPPLERMYREVWNRTAFPLIFKTADLILCTTPLEIEEMTNMGAEKEKCILFPGGIDEEPFNTQPIDIHTKFSLPKNTHLITFIGTLENRKNPAAITKVAQQLSNRNDIFFVIAGHPADQTETIIKAQKELKNLKYIGEINDIEKASLIKSSYANIILSKMEALGLTQLEFMYAGKPVITSAIGGQSWVVRNNIDGIHVNGPNDITGAANAIIKLIEDKELYKKLSQNAKERATQFTMNNLIKQLIQKINTIN